MTALHTLTIKQLSNLLHNKDCSEEELALYFLHRLQKHDPALNTAITIREKKEILKELQKNKKKNHRGALYSIPYVIKDVFVTKNLRTTAGSNVLKNYLPQYSATVKKKLDQEQSILLAKNSQDAWGHGATSENTDFGPVKNPFNITRSAGGSSGGTAAAVAAGFAPFGIAEDTGGSIRNPASYCNTSGLKVTYGRVSRSGAIAYASSLDTVGPIAKSAEDLELILKAIEGVDAYDATTWALQTRSHNYHRLGLVKQFFEKGIDPQVKKVVLSAAKQFSDLGYQLEEVELPNLKYVVPVAYLIAWSETGSNLARYDGIRFGADRTNFTAETKRRIMIGTFALSAGYYDAYYKKAQKIRTLIRTDYEKALQNVDALLAPTSPILPPLLGERKTDPLKDILADWYTYAVNLAGIPSISIPAGFSPDRLPVGMQLIGGSMQEFKLLTIAKKYQSATAWHKQEPDL